MVFKRFLLVDNMRRFASFGVICTIIKRWKHLWRSYTFTKIETYKLCNGTKSHHYEKYFTNDLSDSFSKSSHSPSSKKRDPVKPIMINLEQCGNIFNKASLAVVK